MPAAKRELLISVDVGEQRVAILEDDRVAEVYLERPERRSIAGNIYLGVVDNVLPGMEAAFVEIGLEKNGFLYVDEIVGPELEGRKGARKIQIVTLRDLTADQLAEALEKGVEENSSALELAKIRDRLNEFRATLILMQKIPEKSPIRIDWTGNETRVFVNGMQQGKDIAGADFFQALLRVWIGEKPAQDDLKEALLGKAH